MEPHRLPTINTKGLLLPLVVFLLLFGLKSAVFAATRFEWANENVIKDNQTGKTYRREDSEVFKEQNPTDPCADKIQMAGKEKGTLKIYAIAGQICDLKDSIDIREMGHLEKADDPESDGTSSPTDTSDAYHTCLFHAADPHECDSLAPQSDSSGSSQPKSVESYSAPDCGNDITLNVPLENKDNCLKAGSGHDNPIYRYLRIVLKFLGAGVGLIVMLMIVISGIQYITSSGNPDAVQAAKKRLTNAVLALVLFIFMFAILNFLIPGGLLG